MPSLTKLYSMQEISEHNTKDDCWIIVDGKAWPARIHELFNVLKPRGRRFSSVYDVTSYLDDHPGGDDVVIEATGRDATDDFEDAGHSKDAKELMQSFFIGELDTTSPAIPELQIFSKEQNYTQKVRDLTKQYWVVPVAMVSISVVVGFVYLRKK